MTETGTLEYQREALHKLQETLSRHFEMMRDVKQRIEREQEKLESDFAEARQQSNALVTEINRIGSVTSYVFKVSGFSTGEPSSRGPALGSDNSNRERSLRDARQHTAQARELFEKLRTEMADGGPLQISFYQQNGQDMYEVKGDIKKPSDWGSGCAWMIPAFFVAFVALGVSGGDFSTAFYGAILLAGGFAVLKVTTSKSGKEGLYTEIMAAVHDADVHARAFYRAAEAEHQQDYNDLANQHNQQTETIMDEFQEAIAAMRPELDSIVEQINRVSPPWDKVSWQQRYPQPKNEI